LRHIQPILSASRWGGFASEGSAAQQEWQRRGLPRADTLVLQVGSEKSLWGGCVGDGCAAAPPDIRIAISSDWKAYRIPFDCFGDGLVFDGYYTNVLISAFGTNSSFSIDQVGYY